MRTARTGPAPWHASDPGAGYDGFIGWVLSLMESVGEVGVGLAVLIETFFPPIPSEAVLPGAGFLAYEGRMNVWGAVAAATVASVVGAWCWYGIGAALGPVRTRALLERLPLLEPADMDRSVRFFDRYGAVAVLLGRCVPLVRSFISIPAGLVRMPLRIFTLYTAAGSGVWNGVWIGLGFGFGPAIQPVLARWSSVLSTITVVVLVGLLVIFAVRRLRRTSR